MENKVTNHINCNSCQHVDVCVSANLEENKQQALNALITRKTPYHKRDFLFQAGDELNSLYAVRSGSFKTFTMSSDGKEQITGFHFPGSLLGFDAIAENKHLSFASALETSMICEIPFAEAITSISGVEENIATLISKEINKLHDQSMILTHSDAEQRVTEFILALSVKFKFLGFSSSEFYLSMTRSDIGNYIGLTAETVSRIFNKLQRKKDMKMKGKLITLSKF